MPQVKQYVRVVAAKPLPQGMPILVVFNRFIELILVLRGIKTVEMRTSDCQAHIGKRIALCVSGAGSPLPLLHFSKNEPWCATACVCDEWLTLRGPSVHAQPDAAAFKATATAAEVGRCCGLYAVKGPTRNGPTRGDA